ncbi:MerR family transcriptional regulator [Nocardia aurantiaca]|uniref:MerR family transcriptional regulator n=1 Tax=Nocardia aurantiaca TaxID=2675850 RepID=A0A6I3KY59_9NOCA|nr:MerR family transcriptional regulator [Nocardia aurantiaca]MTE14667.1 MerR family transcriptional regulator [Nocardia aurantiaca]
MLISELSRRTGVSTRALRHYDRSGLLDAERRSNGYRDFPESSVERVRRIRALLEVGLDLSAVASLLPCFAADGRLGGCERARRRLADRIADLDRSLLAITRARSLLAAELARWDRPASPDWRSSSTRPGLPSIGEP